MFEPSLRLCSREVRDDHGQASGACIHADLAMPEPDLVEAGGKLIAERPHQPGKRFRRQLLGTELDEQIGRSLSPAHAAWPARLTASSMGKPRDSRLARYASATERAMVLTRRMKRWRSLTEIACRASSRLKP